MRRLLLMLCGLTAAAGLQAQDPYYDPSEARQRQRELRRMFYPYKWQGLSLTASAGIQAAINGQTTTRYGYTLESILAYEYTPRWFAGVGGVYNLFSWGNVQGAFVNARYYFNEKRDAPFASARFGYGYGFITGDSDFRPEGRLFGLSFGVKRHFYKYFALNFEVGYYNQILWRQIETGVVRVGVQF